MSSPQTLQEWLAAVPSPAVEHVLREEGRVTLLRPKFLSPRLQWLHRFLRRPHFKVRLDAFGSCLWLHLDGERTGAELAEILRLAFGPGSEPSEERASAFLRQLLLGGFIRLV